LKPFAKHEAQTSPTSVRRLELIILLTDLFHRNSHIRETMSGFRAFKAQVPIQWSESLYITLVRGLPGTRKLHRRTLEAMGLRRCHRTRRCSKLAKKLKPTTKLSALRLLSVIQSLQQAHPTCLENFRG
ncbi:hypothetical protein HID58_038336, partial [Brassica napus]